MRLLSCTFRIAPLRQRASAFEFEKNTALSIVCDLVVCMSLGLYCVVRDLRCCSHLRQGLKKALCLLRRSVLSAPAMAQEFVLVAQEPDEIVHIYEYHSSQVERTAILNLRQVGTTIPIRQCEFMSGGCLTNVHGMWVLSEDEFELRVAFNCRHHGGRNEADDLPLHPCILHRIPTLIEGSPPPFERATFTGVDDKAAMIQLVHVRSLAKAGGRWRLIAGL